MLISTEFRPNAIRDDLVLSIHHAYSIYGWKGGDFKASREGRIGPGFTWLEPAKYAVLVFGNIDRDYYASPNLGKSTSVTMAIVKIFH